MGSDLDPAMVRAQTAFERAGLSLEELGRKMGYDEKSARKSAWQFLNRTNDPRLSMLRKFAKAIGVKVRDLIADE